MFGFWTHPHPTGKIPAIRPALHPRPLHFSVLSVVELFGFMSLLSTRSVTYVPGPIC